MEIITERGLMSLWSDEEKEGNYMDWEQIGGTQLLVVDSFVLVPYLAMN